ncbi:ABC transporter ATP-binding protein [Desulfosporosinus sp.]|uniref:ABC transporter ATP-binding protein n=1 Tax=Desulfosporosinus sp. TaxID=157907 RepID=UPI0025C498AD|nr:ABC transporter ATP-binding protein [Desulfosporosinus sp.]MBC2727435.1 ABC transporter ATP-binding protein [Desulfosporosinus sp.]
MIEGINLSKTYGNKNVLRDISLTIPKGEFTAVLGPNGAGKSTLLKILALMSKPDSGEVKIGKQSFVNLKGELKRKIGILSHSSFLYPELTAYENLQFYGRLYDVRHLEEQIISVIKKVGLLLALNEPVYTFSRGMLQRLSIARALIHSPEVIFLDEPFTGLDQQGISLLQDVLKDLKSSQKTILIVTHSFEQGMEDVDRILIINKGQIAADFPTENLQAGDLKRIYVEKVAS